MKTTPAELLDLIQQERPPTSEEFWQQVETAQKSSPNTPLYASGPQSKAASSMPTPRLVHPV
jgi:hypothetical protein